MIGFDSLLGGAQSSPPRVFVKSLCLLLFMCVAALAQPKIHVDQTEVNLGVVYNGNSKTTRLAIKNAGSEVLKITNIKTSCGCTTVKQPKSSLNPGESDVVEVSFDATGFRGALAKYVIIESNDPTTPYLSVALGAEVWEELAPVTRSSILWLGNLPLRKQTQRSISFKNVTNRAISIHSSSTSSPELALRIGKKKVPPGDSVTVTVQVNPEQEGYFSGEFFLHTDSKNQPRVPMRVTYIAVRQIQ